MKKKTVSGMMLILLWACMLSMAFNVTPTGSPLTSEYTLIVNDNMEMPYECWLDAKSLMVKRSEDHLFFKVEFYGKTELHKRFGLECLYLDTDRDSSTGTLLRGIGYDYLLQAYCWGGGGGWGYLWSPFGLIATERSEPPLIVHSELDGNFIEVGIPLLLIGNPTSIDLFAFGNTDGYDCLDMSFVYEIGRSDTIIIDGDPSDWGIIPAVFTDLMDYSPRETDMTDVYTTDNSMTLFHRFDVAGTPTGKLGGQNSEFVRHPRIYYDTDNNPNTGYLSDQLIGAEYMFRCWYYSTSGQTYALAETYRYDPISNRLEIFESEATSAFGTTFEASIPIPALDVSSGSTIRVVARYFTFAMWDSLPDVGHVTYGVTIPALIDIDPNTLNLRSEGKWITAYIELPEGYEVSDIDVSTILLNSTIPAEMHTNDVGDEDVDGVQDLMVKFDRTEVLSYILSNTDLEEGFMTVTLTITGYLDDGTLVEGSDTIKTVKYLPHEIERRSYICEGDTDRLTTPCSYAVDGDWSTKVEWNTTHLGDFEVCIIENFIVPRSSDSLKWEFKAYHKKTGSLMPTPMDISYWDGSSWKQLYALDDGDYVNEVLVETLDVPAETFSKNKISIRTTLRYSSHVVGAIPPYPPVQIWHYLEYFEGRLKE